MSSPRPHDLSLRCLIIGLLTGMASGAALGLWWFRDAQEAMIRVYAILTAAGYVGIASGFLGGLVGLVAVKRSWPRHTAEYVVLLLPILSVAILAAANALIPLF